jgi:hypothetical protein
LLQTNALVAPIIASHVQNNDQGNKMSEFKLNCEHFLATTRQHFFASDSASPASRAFLKTILRRHFCETAHGAHCG